MTRSIFFCSKIYSITASLSAEGDNIVGVAVCNTKMIRGGRFFGGGRGEEGEFDVSTLTL